MKVVYFYWGGNKMSFFNYLSVYSFKKLNPKWKIHFYTSFGDNITNTWGSGEQTSNYTGEDYLPKCKELVDKFIEFDFSKIGFTNAMHPVHKADVLRQYLMYKKSGLWSDMDILWIKSMDNLYNNTLKNIDVTFCHARGYHCSGVVYTHKKNTSVYKDIFEYVQENYNPGLYQGVGPDALNKLCGPIEKIKEKWPSVNIFNFELDLFVPYWSDEIDLLYSNLDENDKITPNTLGIHWFGGHKDSAPVIDSLAEADITNTDINTILLKYIREVYLI